MRVLIISDIHANLTALEAVLADAGPVDAAWCLGDLVGYGPDPNECVMRVRKLPNVQCILGNHDAAALGQIDADTFNPEARMAIQWTQQALWDGSRMFLSALCETVTVEDVTLVHGSPRHPVWEYLMDGRTATINFEYLKTPFCFVGHTHLPLLYTLSDGAHSAHQRIPESGASLQLEPRVIINPGSVGQPRDRDPRAAYAIYFPDTHIWEFHRVPYDIPAVQERMKAARLPERHIQRLALGW